MTVKGFANSFRLRLAAYFVVLALVPMAAAYWGFTTVSGVSEAQQVSSRQDSGLRAALALYQERVDDAQASAERLARSRAFQLELERHERHALARTVAAASGVYVVGPHGLRAGRVPTLAARLPVEVVSGSRRLGRVVAAVPLDAALVSALRQGSAFDSEDVLVLLDGSRLVAASSSLGGTVPIQAGQTATVRVAGKRYRALAAPSFAGVPGARLAVLTPQASIDAADARTRDRLLAALLACLALVAVAAFLVGRSIVRNLRGVATAARGIALGRLGERVPVRGRDEFAALGGAFNEMADQLEARLSELEAERARLRAATSRFGEALAATHDADELLRVIVGAAMEATAARGCRLAVAGGSTLERGEPDADGERLELPLTASAASFGTLTLVGDSFDDEQRLNAVSLAAQAAVALENARLHAIVERQARVDGLTGIANRRACEEALAAEVARSERLGTPLALALADLDGFKAVNDVYGHAAGDDVLRAFAHVLRETVRESDVAGRWGGEEFLLLLPGTDVVGAAQLAERVRAALAACEIRCLDGRAFQVTASFGVAQHASAAASADLLAAADRALYRAKRDGKNRVEPERPVAVGPKL